MAGRCTIPGLVDVDGGEDDLPIAVKDGNVNAVDRALGNHTPAVVGAAVWGKGVGDIEFYRIEDFYINGRKGAVAIATGELYEDSFVGGDGRSLQDPGGGSCQDCSAGSAVFQELIGSFLRVGDGYCCRGIARDILIECPMTTAC